MKQIDCIGLHLWRIIDRQAEKEIDKWTQQLKTGFVLKSEGRIEEEFAYFVNTTMQRYPGE